jgi:hypothetical protein
LNDKRVIELEVYGEINEKLLAEELEKSGIKYTSDTTKFP